MLVAILWDLERACHVENLLALLNGDDAPCGEALAVTRPLDLVEYRYAGVARADKIALQRMADAVANGFVSGHQSLGDDLAAEDALAFFRR